ncbi:MAG: endolytic transglycosylase MltG, partial [Oscillospiraceae bacterium]|nr:endolytic transglycosylase MltG [Oscillospiraceae bacterium]
MKKLLLITLIITALLLAAGCGMLESRLPVSPAPAPESPAASARPPVPPPPVSRPPARETLTLVIPEGFTLARIAMMLEEMGVCTIEEFISAAQEGSFDDFPLVSAQTTDPNRCFTLEGYLFPDTYEIYPD